MELLRYIKAVCLRVLQQGITDTEERNKVLVVHPSGWNISYKKMDRGKVLDLK